MIDFLDKPSPGEISLVLQYPFHQIRLEVQDHPEHIVEFGVLEIVGNPFVLRRFQKKM